MNYFCKYFSYPFLLVPLLSLSTVLLIPMVFDFGKIALLGSLALYFIGLAYVTVNILFKKRRVTIESDKLTIQQANLFLVEKPLHLNWSDLSSFEMGYYNGHYISIETKKSFFNHRLYKADSTFEDLVYQITSRIEEENQEREINHTREQTTPAQIQRSPNPFETSFGKLFFGSISLLALTLSVWKISQGEFNFQLLMILGLGLMIAAGVIINMKK